VSHGSFPDGKLQIADFRLISYCTQCGKAIEITDYEWIERHSICNLKSTICNLEGPENAIVSTFRLVENPAAFIIILRSLPSGAAAFLKGIP